MYMTNAATMIVPIVSRLGKYILLPPQSADRTAGISFQYDPFLHFLWKYMLSFNICHRLCLNFIDILNIHLVYRLNHISRFSILYNTRPSFSHLYAIVHGQALHYDVLLVTKHGI